MKNMKIRNIIVSFAKKPIEPLCKLNDAVHEVCAFSFSYNFLLFSARKENHHIVLSSTLLLSLDSKSLCTKSGKHFVTLFESFSRCWDPMPAHGSAFGWLKICCNHEPFFQLHTEQAERFVLNC